MPKQKKAFTLIELLVVIAIIGVLATVSIIALSNARAKSRDAKRAGDMKQIQTALELFFNDNNRYPTTEEFALGSIFSTSTYGTSTYMQIIPSAPTPVDGNCNSGQNTFSYQQTEAGNSYTISFCLGNTTGILDGGPKCLTPAGIMDVDCGEEVAILPCSSSTIGGEICFYGGENYPTVAVGTQVWMSKNLNYNNGCLGVTYAAWIDNGWCGYYYDGAIKHPEYNLLYQFSGAMNGETDEGAQGICPDGWHIPTKNEWLTLINYVVDNTPAELNTVATWMKSCSQLDGSNSPTYCSECLSGDTCPATEGPAWIYDNTNYGIDYYGLNILPAGYRHAYDLVEGFFDLQSSASFWTSTPDPTSGPGYHWYIRFLSYSSQFYSDPGSGSDYFSFSTRCLKD